MRFWLLVSALVSGLTGTAALAASIDMAPFVAGIAYLSAVVFILGAAFPDR